MDLYEAMRGAPTSRLFTPDPVDREALVRALENARFAPSGGNRQGWRVVVVEDAGRRRALKDLYLPRWRAYTERTGAAAVLADPEGHDPALVRMARRANEYAEGLDEVPMHLVVGVRLGDVLATGTNHRGLSAFQDGDKIELEVEGLGRLHVKVRDKLRRTWGRDMRLEHEQKGLQGRTPQLTGKYAKG